MVECYGFKNRRAFPRVMGETDSSYEDMLRRARNNLPESVKSTERFEIPNVRGHIQGNRTVLSNFFVIADTLHREPAHVFKYILKELATPGDLQRPNVILGRKINASAVNEKVRKYAEMFVICSECGKPDTKLIKEKDTTYIHCQACGARKPVRTIA